jgi:hypothetical protein
MLVNKLLTQTIDLIHATKVIHAIKKLTTAHDILRINQEIIARYGEEDKFCWDKAAIKDLNFISKELIVYHREDFDPMFLIFSFTENVSNLVDTLYANDRVINP